MKKILLQFKRQAVLFKEVAEMVLNQAKPEEVKPWLDLLSKETGKDYTKKWNMAWLPQSSQMVWPQMRKDLKQEVLKICKALLEMREKAKPEDVADAEAYAFAELCSELGHLAVSLNLSKVDEKLSDVAEAWITLFVPPHRCTRVSPPAGSILLASIMQFKGMGCVELRRNNYSSNTLN